MWKETFALDEETSEDCRSRIYQLGVANEFVVHPGAAPGGGWTCANTDVAAEAARTRRGVNIMIETAQEKPFRLAYQATGPFSRRNSEKKGGGQQVVRANIITCKFAEPLRIAFCPSSELLHLHITLSWVRGRRLSP